VLSSCRLSDRFVLVDWKFRSPSLDIAKTEED
jgi:hypothetical protein